MWIFQEWKTPLSTWVWFISKLGDPLLGVYVDKIHILGLLSQQI